jgi:hypothetical protein
MHHKAPKAPPPLVLPPLPSGPLSQVPMDQIPATPAKVTYQGGLLTISAQNSTLSEILRDVRKLTGASIELPSGPNGASERVVTHLGPGTPRDVLVALLNGSSFNYVMLGSNSDPAVVASVILTPKEAAAGQPQTTANAQSPFNPPHPFNPQAVVPMPGNGVPDPNADSDDSADADDTAAADDSTADDQSQPAQPEAPAANAAGQPDPNQPNAGPKTPEQVLEMLRRQQQPGAVNTPQQPPQQPPEQ